MGFILLYTGNIKLEQITVVCLESYFTQLVYMFVANRDINFPNNNNNTLFSKNKTKKYSYYGNMSRSKSEGSARGPC